MIQDPWYLLRSSRMTLCFRRRVKECVCREDVYWIWIIYQTDFNWISCEQYILFCLLFFSNKWERWGIRTKGYLFRYYFTTWCVVDITYKPGNFSLIISSDIFIQWNQQKREWIIQSVKCSSCLITVLKKPFCLHSGEYCHRSCMKSWEYKWMSAVETKWPRDDQERIGCVWTTRIHSDLVKMTVSMRRWLEITWSFTCCESDMLLETDCDRIGIWQVGLMIHPFVYYATELNGLLRNNKEVK